MADDESRAEEGGADEGPKEIEGFKITRAAPVEEKSSPVVMLLVVAVLLVVAGVAWSLKQNDGSNDQADGSDPTATVTPKPPPDVEVHDEVWGRLEFLEDEGRLEQALEYAEEQERETPNKDLRDKIAALREELGIGIPEETYSQALSRAQHAFANKRWEAVLSAASDAIEIAEEAEEDDNHGQAYYLRGVAKSRAGDRFDAITDLETAIEMDYSVDECKQLIDQLSQ